MPFPFDHRYPGTDLHEIDLAYIIDEIRNIRLELKNFADINKLHYADPLDWSITTQYPAFTIVRDANTNVLYISMQPVPEGVGLDNTAYWQIVGVFAGETGNFREAISAVDEGANTQAAYAHAKGSYFWLNDDFYKAKVNISVGTAFTSTNCEQVSVGEELKDLHDTDASLQTQINNITFDSDGLMPVRSGRKYIILMDSYGVTIGSDTGIDTWLRGFLGLTNANSWTYPHSSARFGPNYPDIGTSYQNMLAEYSSSIPKDEITDIIVQTAGNDLSETEADWKDAIDDFIAYAMQEFPNAQIRVAFTLFAFVQSSRQSKYTLCETMKKYIIEHPNISWIENVPHADKDYSACRNTTHPNGEGLRVFAAAIANAILGEETALQSPHAKRAYFTQAGTTDVTAWDTNNGIQSFILNNIVYIRTAANTFTISPLTVSVPTSPGANWNKNFSIDLGQIDDNRFFGSPQTTILFPLTNCAVMFNSIDGYNNQWRYASWAYLTFNDVNNECHAILRFYISNPGGPGQDTALTISKVQFGNSDHFVPACYV